MGYALGTIMVWSLALSGKLVNSITGLVFHSGKWMVTLTLPMSFVRKWLGISLGTSLTYFGHRLLLSTTMKCQSPHAIRILASPGFLFVKSIFGFSSLLIRQLCLFGSSSLVKVMEGMR